MCFDLHSRVTPGQFRSAAVGQTDTQSRLLPLGSAKIYSVVLGIGLKNKIDSRFTLSINNSGAWVTKKFPC